jgi:hypothetical protein
MVSNAAAMAAVAYAEFVPPAANVMMPACAWVSASPIATVKSAVEMVVAAPAAVVARANIATMEPALKRL